MQTSSPSAYDQLTERIKHLREEKVRCEENIKVLGTELYDTITSPTKILSRVINELTGDTNLRSDLLKTAASGVSNYLIFRLVKSAVGSFSANLLDQIIEKTKDTKFEGIVSFLSNLIGHDNKAPK